MAKVFNFTNDYLTQLRREQMENGFLYPLRVTFAGEWQTEDEIPHARVRRISTIDAAVIEALPKDVQDTVWRGISELREKQKELEGSDPDTMAKMLANNEKILGAANIWCQAAFIHPQLVDTVEDVRDPQRQVVLRNIAAEDRIGVLLMSMDGDSPIMARLKMFRPEWASDAEHDAALPDATSTLRVVGTPEPGVQQ